MSPRTPTALADRIVDATARRPHGWLGRRAYGRALGAPHGHEQVFEQLLTEVGSLAGERVLELGCGGGRLIELMLEAGATAIAGIDHSAEMIRLTRARNREAVADGWLSLRLGDVSRLPFTDGAFSLVVSANAFFFFADPARVLAEIHRVLEPGGRIAIATAPGPLPPATLQNWWVWVWGRHLHVYTDNELAELLSAAGLAEIEVRSSSEGHPLQLARARRPKNARDHRQAAADERIGGRRQPSSRAGEQRDAA